MKIIDAIKKATVELDNFGIPNPKIDSEYLLSYVLNIDRLNLYLNSNTKLSKKDENRYLEYIEQRKQRVPLQYIIGHTNFYGLDLLVNENVLIPRSETEYLCEQAINIVSNTKASVLDLCTGSGAIAITISKYCPNAIVYASDISDKALAFAKENAYRNNVSINFFLGNLYQPLNNMLFDLIVSNPPYIETKECSHLQEEVLNEPILALDGGNDGLDLIREIVIGATKHLKKEGLLLMEIGENQGLAVYELLKENYTDIKVIKDLQHKDRYVYSKIKEHYLC